MMQMNDKSSGNRGVFYEIKVEGYLAEDWSVWFGNLKLTNDIEGHTVLSGLIPDQPALHGVLDQIRDLGLNLVSLKRFESS